MQKKILIFFLLSFFLIFINPAYSDDISTKTIDKYTEKISRKFASTYCNTIQFGISNEGALNFSIGETNKEFLKNKLNKYIDYDLLKENILKNVGNTCQVYDLPVEKLDNLSLANLKN